MSRRRARAPASTPSTLPPLVALARGLVIVAVVAVPALFNARGLEGFDAVKAAFLCVAGSLAAVCAAAAAWSGRERVAWSPLLTASLVTALITLVATALGILPKFSLFGLGIRHEGALVMLALAGIAFAVSTLAVGELDAIVVAVIAGSLGPALVAVVPAVIVAAGGTAWDFTSSGSSSLGNPLLFGGYLAPVVPLTVARALGEKEVGRRACFWMVLALQLAALSLTRARGAWLAVGIGALVIGVGEFGLTSVRRRVTGVAVLAVLALTAVVTLATKGRAIVEGPTVQVRLLIWQSVTRTIGANARRLVIGYGPEMLPMVIGPYLSTGVTATEGSFSTPDRAHNDMFDALVTTGICGLIANVGMHMLLWLALVQQIAPSSARAAPWRLALVLVGPLALGVVLALTLLPLFWLPLAAAGCLVVGLFAALAWTRSAFDRAEQGSARWLALGLLGGAVAHFVEIQIGVATMTSQLIWWTIVGAAVATGRSMSRPADAVADGSDASLLMFAGAAAVGVLVLDFHQPATGWNLAATVVIAVAIAGFTMLAASDPRARPHAARNTAGILTLVGGTLALALAAWDVRTANLANDAHDVSGLLSWASWQSHEVTVGQTFLVAVALAIALAGPRSAEWARGRGRFAAAAIGGIAIVAIALSAFPARADMIARLATGAEADRRRIEADALNEERVRLMPASDRAWAAWGRSLLETARLGPSLGQADRFGRAVDALGEAHRRNPFDWLNARNLASAHRVWAAADRSARAVHLDAADRLFQEASGLAPTNPRLWVEWGNLAAERGALHDAFGKLEHAAMLGDGVQAAEVAEVIVRATGVDTHAPAGQSRVAERLEAEGCPRLAAHFNGRSAVP
jgi:hypothetical protein